MKGRAGDENDPERTAQPGRHYFASNSSASPVLAHDSMAASLSLGLQIASFLLHCVTETGPSGDNLTTSGQASC